MKAPAYTLPQSLPGQRVDRMSIVASGAEISKQVLKWTVAIIPGAAIMLAALWAASTPAAHDICSAAVGTAGFVFLALAVDAPKRWNMAFLVTGLALPILGFLGSRMAIEFSVVATLFIAAWIAAGILHRGSRSANA